MRKKLLVLFVVFSVVLTGWLASSASAKEAPRISKERLKALMGSENLVIIDVRSRMDWDAGKMKIKGAVREDPVNFESWYANYPKDKTLVLYCA